MTMKRGAVLVAIVAWGGCAGEAEGACTLDRDCAFGQVCLASGMCGVPGEGTSMFQLDSSGGASSVASLSGFIGFRPVSGERAVVTFNVDGTVNAAIGDRSAPDSVFLNLMTMPVELLGKPGAARIDTGNLDSPGAQACNFDVAYDEWFDGIDVEVSDPRPPRDTDDLKDAGGNPLQADEVVDVEVGVVGWGSVASTTFVVPAPRR